MSGTEKKILIGGGVIAALLVIYLLIKNASTNTSDVEDTTSGGLSGSLGSLLTAGTGLLSGGIAALSNLGGAFGSGSSANQPGLLSDSSSPNTTVTGSYLSSNLDLEDYENEADANAPTYVETTNSNLPGLVDE
jgi:hypothetical protein